MHTHARRWCRHHLYLLHELTGLFTHLPRSNSHRPTQGKRSLLLRKNKFPWSVSRFDAGQGPGQQTSFLGLQVPGNNYGCQSWFLLSVSSFLSLLSSSHSQLCRENEQNPLCLSVFLSSTHTHTHTRNLYHGSPQTG